MFHFLRRGGLLLGDLQLYTCKKKTKHLMTDNQGLNEAMKKLIIE